MNVLGILILLFSFNIANTHKSGIVEYKVKFVNKIVVKETESEDLKKMFKTVDEEVSNLVYTLEFNSNRSHFSLNNYMNNKKSLAKILFGYADYFYSLDANKLIKKDEDMLINIGLKGKWNLTKETKYIDHFLCFKAIKKVIYDSKKGKSEKNVVAWYCPEIPFPFGPKEYNGLPGVILELQDNNSIYIANSIKLLDKNIEINFPNKKTISEEEYLLKIKQSYK